MLDVGRVVIGAPTTSLDVVTEVRDRVAASDRIVTNKGSIALAPAGCDKGTGLLAAIADLGLTARRSWPSVTQRTICRCSRSRRSRSGR